MKPIDRLKIFQKEKGLKNSELDSIMQLSGGAIAKSMNNNASLKDVSIIHLLEFFPELSCEWLLMGKGEMLKGDNLEEGPEEVNKKLENFLQDHIKSLKQENSHLKESNTYLHNKLDECHKLHSKGGKHAC